MRRAGILTFHCADNLGAVLQAHALCRVVRGLGVDCEVIDFAPPSLTDFYGPFHGVRGAFKRRGPLCGARALASALRGLPDNLRRTRNYRSFRRAHLPVSACRFTTPAQLKAGAGAYDFYITGSDQVWNPEFFLGLEGAFFLAFAPTGRRCLSYAASIANEEVEAHAEEFRRYLPRLDRVSVREASSVDFVRRFTDREVRVCLDPSLLLEASDWLKIASPRPPRGDYLLVYDLVRNREVQGLVNRLVADTGLAVISFSPKGKGYDNWRGSFGSASPSEFLALLAGASKVVTSSFHGTAFSLIFNKDFYTVPHPTRGRRMLDLLAALELDSRVFRSAAELPARPEAPDFTRANALLADLRRQSLAYLAEALALE